MDCLAPLGNFIDISVEDIEENVDFGMSFLTDDRVYYAANFSSVFAFNASPLRKVCYES